MINLSQVGSLGESLRSTHPVTIHSVVGQLLDVPAQHSDLDSAVAIFVFSKLYRVPSIFASFVLFYSDAFACLPILAAAATLFALP